jgi:hypothetical protein
MALLSANLILCDTVLWETPPKGGKVPSVIRLMSSISVPPGNDLAHFFAVTFLSSQPGDFLRHELKIQVTDKSGKTVISQAADWDFVYGYILDPSDPGGFILTTEFNIDIRPYQLPLGCLVSACLDGQIVARTPLILRRG